MSNHTILVRATSSKGIQYPWIPYFQDINEEQADRWISASKRFMNVEYKKVLTSEVSL